jgi:hypothetical protein
MIIMLAKSCGDQLNNYQMPWNHQNISFKISKQTQDQYSWNSLLERGVMLRHP